MSIYRIPGQIRYNTVKAGSLFVSASANITGNVNTATGVNFDATLDVAEYVDCATGIASCAVTAL